jgi:hypothetical protein
MGGFDMENVASGLLSCGLLHVIQAPQGPALVVGWDQVDLLLHSQTHIEQIIGCLKITVVWLLVVALRDRTWLRLELSAAPLIPQT